MGRFIQRFDSEKSAAEAMVMGGLASAILAVLHCALGAAALIVGHPVWGVTALGLVDGVLYGFIAWRMVRLSLLWATVGLITFSIGTVYMYMQVPDRTGLFGYSSFLFLLGYFNAIRGGLYLRKRLHA